MTPMVQLRQVTKQFADFTAVRDVDLEIHAGEFMTFLGPSGCGKTTLLRMISGFEIPSSGQILLDGADVTNLPPYSRNVNQVFQSYALFPHLSVRDNIAFGLKMKKVGKAERDERVAAAVDMVSLGGMEDRRPSQLSGGQRQRVALARAIVCRPKVLLLDEPLSALDAKLRHAMQIELKRLQYKLGITFIFVTHDQEEALTMSDRIAIINKGRIEQIGNVDEIYHQPKTTFAANFIGQANIVKTQIVSREGGQARLRIDTSIILQVDDMDVAPGLNDVLVSIRPEKIEIRRTADGSTNVFPARVVEEIFRGATDQFLLRTESGFELTAVAANESASKHCFHAGDQVFCHLHADDIVVLQGE